MKLLRSRWQSAVLVCGKCSNKVGGGFGRKGKTPLAKALRVELGVGKGRKSALGVVETKCLGVCPKHAVTVLAAGRPDAWLLVRPGTPLSEVLETLAPLPIGERDVERSETGRGGVTLRPDSAPLPGCSAAVPLPGGERV